jgi:hypothetical protein
VEGVGQLYDHFRVNYDALESERRSEILLYALTVKLSKLEEFKNRERNAFEMVKNLFTFPGRFNKEQLELFAASFMQNTQACMSALEKGGSEVQVRDMENKLFASLLWALTFSSGVDTQLRNGVEDIWQSLVSEAKGLALALKWVETSMTLETAKIALFRRAAALSVEEMLPQLSI